jgi:PAS domain S-box-containing protein
VRSATSYHGGVFATQFEDENTFFFFVTEAYLNEDVVATIISNGLLAISDESTYDANWISLECTLGQLMGMGLNVDLGMRVRTAEESAAAPPDSENLSLALTASPSPIVLLSGPQHAFTFINYAYVRLMGRNAADSVLGRPVREAMPELQGQPFFGLLDKVYRTGEPFIGREIPGKILNEATGELGEFIFDFVYHPVLDLAGEVCAILCQANDVSDRVLARQVSEARETKLYEQWAELDAIYKNAPFGMALIEVGDYRIVRINDVNAALIGRTAQELIGQRVFDLFPEMSALKSIYERIAAGEEVQNVRFEVIPPEKDRPVRHMLANFNPVLNARGEIAAIATISLDLAEPMKVSEHVVMDFSSPHVSH